MLVSYGILIGLSHLVWVQALLAYLNNQIQYPPTLLQDILTMIRISLRILLLYLHNYLSNIGYVEKGIQVFTPDLGWAVYSPCINTMRTG